MSSARSFKKRRYKATRGTRKKPYVPSSVRKVITRNVRTGGYVDIENKFLDTENVNDNFTTTWDTMDPDDAGTVQCVSAVAQGDGESNRDGRVYHINSLHMQGRFSVNAVESAAFPGTDLIARIVVVWDTQTNGAQLTATSVMDGGQTDDHDAFRNLQFTKRFRVLFDRKVLLPIQTTNEGAINLFANNDMSKLWKFNHTFKTPIKVICNGTTGVIASITDNSIHVIGVANSATVQLSYQSRIRFTG